MSTESSIALYHAGRILPPDSLITGTLIGYSRLQQPSAPGLKLLLSTTIPSATGPTSDYTSPLPAAGETTCRVTVALTLPSGSSSDRLIERDEAQLKALIKKTLSIEASGLEVVRYGKGDRMLEAEIRGTGDRMIKLENRDPIYLLRMTSSMDSNTPSWINSPSPPLDSSTFDRSRDNSHNKLRPITSLPVPNFTRPPQAGSSRTVPGVLQAKRYPSPDQELSGTAETKRRKLEETQDDPDVFVAPFPKHNGFSNRSTQVGGEEGLAGPADISRLDAVTGAVPAINTSHDSSSTKSMQHGQATSITGNPGRDTLVKDESFPSRDMNPPGSADSLVPKAERPSPIVKSDPQSAGPSHLTHIHLSSTPSRPLTRLKDSMVAIAEANRRREEQLEAERLQREAEGMGNELQETDLQRPAVIGAARYLPIDQHREQTWGSVMGIVVQHPLHPKAGRDHMLSVVIGDPSSHAGGLDREGMVVTIFRPRPEQLPQVYKGQAIMFRDILFKMWNEKIKGNAYSSDQGRGMNVWASMSRQGTIKTSTPAMIVSEGEKARMKSLLDWWDRLNGEQTDVGYVDEGQGHDALPTKRKECDLALVREGDFCDPTFKILQIQHNTFREPRYEMYITDGTVNPQPTHNWHNLEFGLPASAVWTMAIFGEQPADVSKHFIGGNYLMMRNVNVKRHRGNGALELKWSEKVTTSQKEMGWKNRTVAPISRDDYRATEINRKVNILTREQKEGITPLVEDPLAQAQVNEAPARPGPPPLATHISTIHRDLDRHRLSTMEEIKRSTVFPNKFRLRARVSSIHARAFHPSGKEDFTTHFCKDCQKPFPSLHVCIHCKDHTAQIELRYRLIAMLEADDEVLPIIIADDVAEKILPPLPPITTSESEHDKRRKETRIAMANVGVLDTLLGAKMDGERTRPIIDWTIEVYVLTHDKGDKKKSKEVRVIMARACDMEARA